MLGARARVRVRRLHERVAQGLVRVAVRAGAGLAAGRAALIEPQARLPVCLRPVQPGVAAAGLSGARAATAAGLAGGGRPRAVLEDRQVGIGGVARHGPGHGGVAVDGGDRRRRHDRGAQHLRGHLRDAVRYQVQHQVLVQHQVQHEHKHVLYPWQNARGNV
jgi:hypothetical protein